MDLYVAASSIIIVPTAHPPMSIVLFRLYLTVLFSTPRLGGFTVFTTVIISKTPMVRQSMNRLGNKNTDPTKKVIGLVENKRIYLLIFWDNPSTFIDP